MNRVRASQILLEQLEKVKAVSYEALKELVIEGKSNNHEIVDGNITYEIEVEYFWDNSMQENIRVAGAINESGGWSAYWPLVESFIIRPDGSLVE